jgi:lipid-A-disaccharide synthase
MRTLLGGDPDLCSIKTGEAHDLMQRAAAGMVCSGTATLECAYFGLPMVILYKVAWLTWAVGKWLVRVPFLGMPNILANREIVKEFLQDAAQPKPIADEILRLLSDADRRAAVQRDLAQVTAQLGEPGAGKRAARVICRELGLSPA